MSLYDTLNQLKTKVHCSEMTAATALDTLYQAAIQELDPPDHDAPVGGVDRAAVLEEAAEACESRTYAASADMKDVDAEAMACAADIRELASDAQLNEDPPVDPDELMNG